MGKAIPTISLRVVAVVVLVQRSELGEQYHDHDHVPCGRVGMGK